MKVLVVAEIGINHNGDVGMARDLIDLAVAAGCDAVKFQKRTVEVVYRPEFLDSPRVSVWGTTVRAQKLGLEFGQQEYEAIDGHCRAHGIPWFASAWDAGSLLFLSQFQCPYNKVASAMVTCPGFLPLVVAERRPTFLSTGMCTWPDLFSAVNLFRVAGCSLTLLHTVSVYPCPEVDLNLRRIPMLRELYGCPVGYSGHEVSPVPSILAVALGAVVVERHITLSRALPGSDHAASLERRGLEMLVEGIRAWERSAGDGAERILPGERETARKLRYWEAMP